MSRGLNKVSLIGHLGKDPETRYLPDGTAISNFSVAMTEQWKDKNSGEKREHTEWVRISMFGQLAEIAAEYLKKGSQVYLEGKLRTRKWQDKTDGKDRYATEVNANSMIMLGGGGNKNGTAAPPASAPPTDDGASSAPPPDAGEFDDDIPFAHAWALPLVGALLAGLQVAQYV